MRRSGESGHQPGVPEKGLESPSQNAEGSREWGGWREPELDAAHPCGPAAQGVWKRKKREAEKQKDPRQTDVREPRPGGQWRETPDGSGPRGPDHKASSKATQSGGRPQRTGQGKHFLFYIPFHCVHKSGWDMSSALFYSSHFFSGCLIIAGRTML